MRILKPIIEDGKIVGYETQHVDGMGCRIGTVIFDEKMCCMGFKFVETTVFDGAVLFKQLEVIHDKEQQ